MSKARDIASAAPAPSAVSATELGYVDGVTSAIQTQIDSKIGSASAINPTIVDAKGDIIAATAADTVARLAVGANDTILTADSTTATGLKWAAPAGGAMPTFSAYDTATQSINANVYTKITFTTESWDTNSAFASSRFTPLTAGYYSVSAMVGASFGAAETTYWQVYKNGSSWQMGSLIKTTGDNYGSGHILVYLNGSSDYIEIFANSSNNATIGGTAATRYFAAVGIRS